jgi:predicted naringenin-chalcone synthase
MTILTHPAPGSLFEDRADARRRAAPRLLGLGTAVPGKAVAQSEMARRLARAWGLSGSAHDRWHRIVDGSCIDTRHFAEPIDRVIGLSTGQRMRLYEQDAPPLALRAAAGALDTSGVRPAQVTDLIIVSCTGLSAPGVDVELVRGLGLGRDVHRSLIGFMGCFGAITGLRAAVGACAARPDAVALVVCVELCSLHARADRSVENQVASALFADGAAAVVVAGEQAGGAPADEADAAIRVTLGRSLLMPEARGAMSWRIGDDGCAMRLDAAVPELLREAVGPFVGKARPHPRSLLVHPGGPEILRAVEDALDLDRERDLAASWSVLRSRGNMSSATLLFVLEQGLRSGSRLPGLLLSFGPGLALESLSIGAFR